MTSPTTPSTGARPWLHALRRTWWILLALVAVVPVAVVLEASARDDGAYRATATVAAMDLEPDGAGLARTAEALFRTAEVAEAIRAEVPARGDPGRPPEAVEVEPVLDTVLVRVHGTHPDPEVAAALADAGADALAEQLARVDGLGRFEVIGRARPPAQDEGSAPSPLIALVGLVAAGSLGLLVLLVTMSGTRAVFGVDDLRSATAASWTAELVGPFDARGVPGVGALAASGASTVLLVGVGVAESDRSAIASALAAALAADGPVELVLLGDARLTPGGLPDGIDARTAPLDGPLVLSTEHHRRIVDVDASDAQVDAVRPDAGEVAVVVLAREGVPLERVRDAATRRDPATTLGAVLVRGGARR